MGLGPLAGPAGLAVARARHPAIAGDRPDALVLASRVCRRLADRGAVAPEVAAAVAATRGQWGVDRCRFGALVGVGPDVLMALEAGRVGVAGVPAILLAADPFAPILARLRSAALGMVAVTDDRREG